MGCSASLAPTPPISQKTAIHTGTLIDHLELRATSETLVSGIELATMALSDHMCEQHTQNNDELNNTK